MSEFLDRLQARLKASSKGSFTLGKSIIGKRLGEVRTHNIDLRFISPVNVSRLLGYLLILASTLTLTYWVMRVAQIPDTPVQASNSVSKNGGVTLYANQEANTAYSLFGSKPLVTDNIYLRGVVITGKTPSGALDGFAIFEIEGKSGNVVSPGESLGKGLSLQSIATESATLLYQGQALSFNLSKAGKDKGAAKSNSNNSTNNSNNKK